jgi:hypothetical protein
MVLTLVAVMLVALSVVGALPVAQAQDHPHFATVTSECSRGVFKISVHHNVGSGVVNAIADAHDSEGTYLGSAYYQLDLVNGGLYSGTIEYKARPVDTVTFRVYQDPGGGAVSAALIPLEQDLNIYDTITILAGCDRAAGCSEMISLDGAVMGTFTSEARLFGQPGQPTEIVIEAGKTYHVLGLDESKEYYMILIGCSLAWVEVGTVGPTNDAVWGGRPLPTFIFGEHGIEEEEPEE